jgi:hypothetical protein
MKWNRVFRGMAAGSHLLLKLAKIRALRRESAESCGGVP